MLFHQFGCNADDELSLPVLDKVQGLQHFFINYSNLILTIQKNYLKGGNDVGLSDTGHVRQILDGQSPTEISENLQQHPGPVTAVAQLSQVRQRLLRTNGHLEEDF